MGDKSDIVLKVIERKGEVIRATNCCNLQLNIVALQVEEKCCSYYRALMKR